MMIVVIAKVYNIFHIDKYTLHFVWWIRLIFRDSRTNMSWFVFTGA